MSIVSTAQLTWVIVTLSDLKTLIEKSAIALLISGCTVHPEDIISSAVFQLNARERPILVDDLLNMYVSLDSREVDSLTTFLTDNIEMVYDRLCSVVPGNMDVKEYDFVGDDIMIGGTLF